MKNRNILITCFSVGVITNVQAQHCQLTLFVQGGCGADNTGFAQVDSVVGAAAPLTYLWSNGDTTAAVSGLANGTYQITVTDDNGCTVSDSVIIDCAVLTDCRFITYDQETWGASGCEGLSAYLNAHFAECFPTGLTVGITRRVVLTTPQAIINFLPSSGTPRALDPVVRTNPGQSYKNTLAGHLAAAMLNVTFDACDPGFSLSNGQLGSLIVREGAFAGKSVTEVIALANAFLDGQSVGYTASQLSSELKKINENFEEGEQDDHLICGPGCHSSVAAGPEGAHIGTYPVPASSTITVELPQHDAPVSIGLADLNGRLVSHLPGVTSTKALLNIEDLPAGVYLLSVSVNGSITTRQVVVSK